MVQSSRSVRRPVMIGRGMQRRHRPDYLLMMLSVILLAIGLIVIYAISPALTVQKHVSDNYYVSKQVIAIILGIIAFLVAANIPLQVWRKLRIPLVTFAAIGAIAVRVFGEQVNGAYRWVQIRGFSFQPVELIKFSILIWLAVFLSKQFRDGNLGNAKQTFRTLLIVLLIVGVVVAKIQSDLGSTGVIVAIMAAMCFVVGLPLKRILLFGGIVLVGVVLAISTNQYRRDRLLTFMHPERDCQTTGYQACQALIAVGSGGLFGKGLAHGAQAYGYVPEAANDSIFAIIAEKFGFVGVTVLLCLFMVLFTRLRTISERAPDEFSQLLVVGILAWLSTQTMINIGAMIGLLPLKGITLPFISYGGTSIIFISGAMGIVFNISRYTTYTAKMGLERGSNDDLVSGGGTAGHITPILAVAHELKRLQPDCKIVYVGEAGGKFQALTDDNSDINEVITISAGKFRRYYGESWLRRVFDIKTILLNIRDLFRLLKGFLQALFVLARVKPDIIFLKGGYVGVPIGIAAVIKRMPFITHDSDIVPGLANRLVGRWAEYHATGMPADFYSYPSAKTRYVGVLVSKDYQRVTEDIMANYRKQLDLPKDHQILLITGGSHGAKRLNDAVKQIIPKLISRYPGLTIIHQVGMGNLDLYSDLPKTDQLLALEFMSGMYLYTGSADVVVTRGGANTLAELGVQAKACVVVPNPQLTAGHQLKNAQYLLEKEAIIVVDETTFIDDANNLEEAIEELLDNDLERHKLGDNLHKITKTDAAQELAQLLISAAGKAKN